MKRYIDEHGNIGIHQEVKKEAPVQPKKEEPKKVIKKKVSKKAPAKKQEETPEL